jgi:hypothetical protein
MTLNITAERRVDISDYGKGWDNCYLTVKSMNPKALKDWQEMVEAEQTGDETIDSLYAEKLKTVLVGGVIMNTNDDGVAERYTIEPEDIADVVEALGPVFKQRALMVAAGTYGLKGL